MIKTSKKQSNSLVISNWRKKSLRNLFRKSQSKIQPVHRSKENNHYAEEGDHFRTTSSTRDMPTETKMVLVKSVFYRLKHNIQLELNKTRKKNQ